MHRTQVRLDLHAQYASDDVKELVRAFERGHEERITHYLSRLSGSIREGLHEEDQRIVLRIEYIRALVCYDDACAESLLNSPLLSGDQDLAAICDLMLESGGSIEEILERYPKASMVVQAQLLLDLGRLDAAVDILGDPKTPLELAMRARAEARKGERDLALAFADDAMKAADGSISVIGSAMAAQFSCCAAEGYCTDPGSISPHPLPFGMLREDETAVSLIECMLDNLKALPCEDRVSIGRFDRFGWEVALLCSLSGRNSDAAGIISEDLKRTIPSPMAVVWALEKNLPIDIREAIRVFRNCLANGDGGPEHLFVTVGLLELSNQEKEARTLIGRFSSRFRRLRGFEQVKNYWMLRLREGPQPDELSALIQEAIEKGDWNAASAFVSNLLEVSGKLASPELLRLGSALVSHKCWNDLTPFLSDIEAIGTGQAIRLAAFGHSGAKRPSEVVRILTDHMAFFSSALPRDLTHLKADALEALGHHQKAVELLRMLPQPDIFDQTRLGSSLLRAGRIDDAAYVFDQLAKDDLPAEYRISAAAAVRPHRPDVSRRLIEPLVVMQQVPVKLLGSFWDIANKLGMEGDTHFVIQRMLQDDVPGLLKIDSAEEMLALIKERERRRDVVETKYREGTIPIPVYAEADGKSVAAHLLGMRNELIFARHGSRLSKHSLLNGGDAFSKAFRFFPTTLSKTLILDYPGLILLHRFGLLEDIVSHSEHILIPAAIPAALNVELTELLPSESRLSDYDRDLLRSLGPDAELPKNIHTVVILVDDNVSEESSAVEVSQLNSGKVNLPASVPLLLTDSAIKHLLRANKLDIFLEKYKIHVMEEFGKRLQERFDAEAREKSVCKSLRELVNFIDKKLDSKQIEILPHGEEAATAEEQSLPFLALLQIVDGRYPENANILTGDRFLAGYITLSGAETVDIETALGLLEVEGTISVPRARRVRSTMRRANVLFMADPCPDAKVVALSKDFANKTSEAHQQWTAIRCNMAIAIAMSEHLRIDDSVGMAGHGCEAPVIRDASLTALELVRYAWTDHNLRLNHRCAVSDAAINDLLYLRIPGNLAERDETNARHWAAQTYGMLLATAFIVVTHDHRRVEDFLRWFESRFGFDLLNDPLVSVTAIHACQAGLSSIVDAISAVPLDEFSNLDRHIAALVGHVCEELPEQLVQKFDPELLLRAGIRTLNDFEIDHHRISLADVSLGLRSNDEKRIIKTQSGIPLQIEEIENVGFSLLADDRRYKFSEPDYDLLRIAHDTDPAQALMSIPWLGTTAEADRVLANLQVNLTPKQLNGAAVTVYGYVPENLKRKAEPGISIDKSMFYPPAPDILFSALGIDRSASISDLDVVPAGLTALDAALVVMRRLHIPRRLDPKLLDQFAAGSQLLEDALSKMRGPIACRMARRLAADAGLPTTITCGSIGAVEFCTALVRWSLRRFDRDPRWREIAPHLKLAAAWFHAGEICVALGEDIASSSSDLIDGWDPRSPAASMGDSGELHNDVCGKQASGQGIAFALAGVDPEPSVLQDYLESLKDNELFELFETKVMPDLLGSIVSEVRQSPPIAIGKKFPILDPARVEADLRSEPLDITRTRDPHIWNVVLHLVRRGAEVELRDKILATWRGMNIADLYRRDYRWLVASTQLINAFGPFLTAEDLREMALSCHGVLLAENEGEFQNLRSELLMRVAVEAARCDDKSWAAVVSAVVCEVGAAAPLWRHALCDDLFNSNLRCPTRAADLLRRLRAVET